jgi:hypothetical protein
LQWLSKDPTFSTLTAVCEEVTIPSLLAGLPQTMINLNMVSPLLVMLRGSRELRSYCLPIFLAIWDRDHTLFTADLQTLELLSSFDPQMDWFDDSLVYRLLVECVSWMVGQVTDQLLIDSNILKNLLELINKWQVLQLFSQLLQILTGDQEHDAFLRYLVDDLGVLPHLVKVLGDNSRMFRGYHSKAEKNSIKQTMKNAIRAVMRHDKRYEEMVSRIEMTEGLRAELMSGQKKGKRKRADGS